jgi:hypothetical protein
MVAVAATVANAVAAALSPLGIEVRDLPLSPAQVWRLANESGVARDQTSVRAFVPSPLAGEGSANRSTDSVG